jgi:DNA polymerase III subunit delta'
MPFRTITGHRPLLELLSRAIARGTLPQSLLFAGPEGVGKRLTAIALAQALNCERPVPLGDIRADMGAAAGTSPDDDDMVAVLGTSPSAAENDACGACASYTRIARGVHADVLVVEPGDTGAIRIEQIRDVVDRAGYRPFEGRRRVVAIDAADALGLPAQDAILKTLEEPPPASVFVLITDRPDVLLPTVRSRCQRLRFGPLSPSEVAAVLIREAGMSPAEAHAAAAASGGSIGRAIAGAEEGAMDARDVAARLLQGVATTTDPRRRLDGAKLLTGGGSDRDELSRRLLALSSLVRDLGLLGARADDRTLANADLKPRLQSLLTSYDGDRALRAYSVIDRALDALGRNASPKIVADWLALNL